MRRASWILVLAGAAALTSACTSAGPFVTNISNAGDGRLVVEKCLAQYNMWTGTLSNSDCGSSTIRIESSSYAPRRR